MKYKILLFAFSTLLLGACHTAYRSGQTPDDVYYSPVRGVDETTERKNEETTRYSQHERQIIMSRYDRRWRDFDDDFDCRYDPYRWGYAYGYYYNPYYYPFPVFFTTPVRNPKNSTPRMTNLSSYQYQQVVVTNPKTGAEERSYRGRRYNLGNQSRETRMNSSPGNNRSYSPSSSGGRGSGTPVSRPSRL